jgi:hypothetical protein
MLGAKALGASGLRVMPPKLGNRLRRSPDSGERRSHRQICSGESLRTRSFVDDQVSVEEGAANVSAHS